MRIVAFTQYTSGFPALKKQVELDLFGNEDISIKYEVDNIREANSKNSSYSKSYDIPATKKNNKFFRHIYDLQSDMKGQPNAVLNAFNPYKSCDVLVYSDGSLILEGIMFLNEIKEKNQDYSYNVTVYSNSVGLLNALGESTIDDLDFSDIDCEITLANIQAGFTGNVTLTNGTTSDNIFFPLVDDGNIGYDTAGQGTLSINSRYNFAPHLQMHYIVNKIFDFAGYTYNSSFFDSTEFGNIYMDSSLKGDFTLQTAYGDVVARPSGTTTITTSFATVVFDIETNDPDALHNASNGVYTAPQDNLETTAVCSFFIDNSNSSARTLEIKIQHNSTSPNQVASSIIHTEVIPGNANNHQVFAFENILINNGETIEIQVKGSASGLTIEDSFVVGGTTLRSRYYFYTNNLSGAQNIFQRNRRNIKLADIIRDLTKMFNLIIEPDQLIEKQLNILPFNEFVADGVEHNRSDKIDRSEIKQTMFDLPSRILFSMAEDSDDFYHEVYKQSVGEEYGSQEVLLDVESENTEEIKLDVFAASAIVEMHSSYAPLSVVTSSSDGIVFERFDNAPRLVFKNFRTHNAPTAIFDSFANLYQGTFGSQVTLYGNAHHYEDDTDQLSIGHSTLTFGNVGNIFTPISTVPLQTLYNKYWKKYIEERYINLAHLVTVRINLKSRDINEFSFADTVRIDNQIYRVNSIDYTTGRDKLAKVELYRIY